MRESAYLRVLREHLRNIPLQPNVITHIEVRHDEWCAIFEGFECNCEPDVASGPAIQAKYEGEDGA